jgi:3-oxoacyl-[acyl-carrier-protein] synthase II
MRPFDRSRDGVVLGEGDGAIVIERGSHAAARGATPLARLVAYDRSFRDPRSPRFDAAIARSLRTALERGERTTRDLGFASAHAASDRTWDAVESRGIAETLGDLPVWAPKSYFGDLGPGSSIVE